VDGKASDVKIVAGPLLGIVIALVALLVVTLA